MWIGQNCWINFCHFFDIVIVARARVGRPQTSSSPPVIFNDILHMSFIAGTHVFKAFPAYTTTEL